ncbi:MAG: potassium channel family protein [Verrucomicrobiota bacterium]
MSSFGSYRSVFLLCVVLLSMLFSPLFSSLGVGWSKLAFGIFWAFLIGVGGYKISSSRRWLRFYATAVFAVMATALHELLADSTPWVTVAQNAGILMINFGAMYAALQYAIQKDAGNAMDRTIGAICGYFLLGMAWSRLYVVAYLLLPGSFNASASADTLSEADLIYFSIVTLTTLGYGDISAVDPYARILSAMEAAFGTLYLAVLIAALVSEIRSDAR